MNKAKAVRSVRTNFSHKASFISGKIRLSRTRKYCRHAVWISAAAMAGIGKAQTNTADIFNTTATDLSVGANYATPITPTAASAYDVEFSGTYTTPTLDVNGGALNFGTLNDVDTQALVITNSNAAAGSITLSSPANSVSGTPADLLYVATGGNLNFSSGTAGGYSLIIGATGNIDNVGTLMINAPVSIAPASTVTFIGAGTTTINGSIGSTTAAIVLGSTGSLILAGSNTYTGGTTFNGSGGAIRVMNNNALGTGTVTFNTSGTLATNLNGAATTISNPVVVNTGAIASFDGGYANLTLTGNISGGGLVNKTSTGYVVFSGTNTYTGGTNLSAGFTTFSSSASVPTTGRISISTGAALIDSGAFSTVMGVLGSVTVLNTSGGSIALTANSSETINYTGFTSLGLSSTGPVTYSGTITPGTNGYEFGGPSPSNLTVSSNLGNTSGSTALTATGTGIVTLTGTNSYTGLTTISTSGDSLILASPGTVTAYTGGFSIATGTTLTENSGTNINIGAGIITVKSAILNVGGSLTSNSNISIGTNSGNQVNVLAGGILTAPGLSDSYQSNYTINGYLNVSGGVSMAVNAINTISGTGTFNMGSFTLGNTTRIVDSLAVINVTGALSLGVASAGAYFNVASGSVVNAGSLANSYNYNVSNNGAINVAGLTSTSVNSYALWSGNGSLGTAAYNLSNYTILTESMASFNVSGAVNIGSGSSGSFNQTGGTVNFTSSGNNVVIGSSTTGSTYGAYNVVGGTFNVPNSSLVLGSGSSSNGTLNIFGGSAILKGISFNSTGIGTLNISGGAVSFGSGGIVATVAGTRNVTFGGVTVSSFGDWSSNVPITLASTSPNTTFNLLDSVNGTTAHTVTLSGGLSGSGGLNVNGPGTLILGGSNNYQGPTNVNSGTFLVNGTLSNSTALTLASGTTIGGAGTISGFVTIPSGANVQAGFGGTGTLSLGGNLTFSGASNINIGVLSNYASTAALTMLGSLTASGANNSIVFNVASLVGTTPGATYILASYGGGSIAGTGNSAFTVGTLPGGTVGVLSFPSGQIDLTIGGANLFWTGAQNNSWDTTSTNFATINSSGGATATQYTDNAGEQVVFGDSVAGIPVTNTTVNISSGTVNPAAVTFNNSSTNYTIQSGKGYGIGGAGGITLSGTGTVTITTANTFTGGTILNAGLLVIPGDSALGAVPSVAGPNITFNGGSLQFTSPTTLNANRSIVLNGNGLIDIDSNAVSIPGVISGSGVLIPANTGNLSSGVLSLSGNNTFTGGTLVNAGITLNIAGDSSLGAVPAAAVTSLNISGGTLQAGASSISLTANRMIFIDAPGATIDLNSDSLAIAGQVTGTGQINVINTGNGSGGVLKLITTSTDTDTGPLNILAGTVDIGNVGSNYVYSGQDFSTINVSSGANLVFTGTNTFGYAGAGSYKPAINIFGGTVTNGGADNYIGGRINMTGGTITGTADFRLQAYTTVSSSAMVTTNPASTTATINVTTFIMYSNTIFNVSQGTVPAGGPDLLIASNFQSSGATGFTSIGNGVLELTGINNYSGGTTVNAGKVIFAGAKAFPTFTNLTVNGGIAVAAAHASGLTGAAKNNLFVNTLSLAGGTGAWTGQVDLNNNDMIVQGSSSSTSISTINSMVAQGYNGGNWNGPGGIVSSSAAANTSHLTALGVILNDDGTGTSNPLYTTFDGAATVENDVLVKYTYYGDTNLNGSVDGGDYSRIDNGALSGLTGWFNGDFNYDGVINGSDYTLIDNAYNTQGPAIAAELAGSSAVATAQIATAAVPEPASLALLGMGAIGLLGRARPPRRK